ncbi:hypothetical protein GGH94_001429 [Coemansia aciculifera]|uniref:Carboxypeptidase n=1 Tax=Coemansia aciculifera TaxID=417176 RepID=A0A9W8M6F5_9FUNG|nr:hypothetical protein GGH94_001429 [Coemansia aciculifera]KAJ2875970.1 hypothetical protein GGH93_001175 [Coemansia aciculifera]
MPNSLLASQDLLKTLPFGGPKAADPALVDSSQWSKITTMKAYPDYRLRVKSPNLCDTNVTQYTGYLDTAEDKHFFFWFFEARNQAKTGDTPVILWTNGGPGCSSLVGVLMELGPCRVNKGGAGTSHNPYGWNENAHVIFIDQPLNTGFSYGQRVDNSYDAGKDVNVFLRMFYHLFPKYASSQLHVFGESYAGHYVPAIGKAIHETNQVLAKKRQEGTLTKAEESVAVLPLPYTTWGRHNNPYNVNMPSKPLHLEIPPLLAAGIRVLIYAGDADWICNWYGNKAYAQALVWPGQTGFNQMEDLLWTVDGEDAGEVRTHRNLTFIRVFGSGHFVPLDRPKSALDMINRWVSNKAFS